MGIDSKDLHSWLPEVSSALGCSLLGAGGDKMALSFERDMEGNGRKGMKEEREWKADTKMEA